MFRAEGSSLGQSTNLEEPYFAFLVEKRRLSGFYSIKIIVYITCSLYLRLEMIGYSEPSMKICRFVLVYSLLRILTYFSTRISPYAFTMVEKNAGYVYVDMRPCIKPSNEQVVPI